MSSFIKTLLSLSWPSILVYFLQIVIIILTLVYIKKVLKWWGWVCWGWEELEKVGEVVRERWVEGKKGKKGEGGKQREMVQKQNMDIFPALSHKILIKQLLKIYSILQTCLINIPTNKIQLLLIFQYWIWIILQLQILNRQQQLNLQIISKQNIILIFILFCWNGVVVVCVDFIVQVFFLGKFIKIVVVKQKSNQEEQHGSVKQFGVLYVYYIIACLLICTFSTLTINKILSVNEQNSIYKPLTSSSLLLYIVLILSLLLIHHFLLILLSIIFSIIVMLLPNRFQLIINVWLLIVFHANNKIGSTNRVKPLNDSIQVLNFNTENVENIVQREREVETNGNFMTPQKTKISKKKYFKNHKKLKQNYQHSQQNIVTTQSNKLNKNVQEDKNNQLPLNLTTSRNSFKSNKIYTKYSFDRKSVMEEKKQKQMEEQREISLFLEEHSSGKFGIPKTPQYRRYNPLFHNNLQKQWKSVRDRKQSQSTSQPILSNIENSIYQKSKRYKNPKKNSVQYLQQRLQKQQQTQIIDLSNYLLKNKIVGIQKYPKCEVLKVLQNYQQKKQQQKQTACSKTNYVQILNKNNFKKNYQFTTNPSIPQLDQNGEIFCFQALESKN